MIFLIMILVKARNLKTTGIRESKKIKHWGVKEKAPSADKASILLQGEDKSTIKKSLQKTRLR